MIKMLQSAFQFLKKEMLVVAFSVLITLIFTKSCNEKIKIVEKIKPTSKYHTQIVVQKLTKAEMQQIADSLKATIKTAKEIKEVIKYVSIVDTYFEKLPIVEEDSIATIKKIDSNYGETLVYENLLTV